MVIIIIIIIIILGIYPPQALANAKHYSKEPSIPSEASCSQLPSEVIVSPSVSILQMAPFKHLSGYTCYTRTPHGKMSARINPKLVNNLKYTKRRIYPEGRRGTSTRSFEHHIIGILLKCPSLRDLKTQGTPISTITACTSTDLGYGPFHCDQ